MPHKPVPLTEQMKLWKKPKRRPKFDFQIVPDSQKKELSTYKPRKNPAKPRHPWAFPKWDGERDASG